MRIGSASLIDPFRSSIARPTDALVYASKETSRSPPQDSGSGWSRFLLSCRDSSSPATCRFIPAHPQTRLEPATLPLTAEGKRMPEYWSFRAIFDALAVPRMADAARYRRIQCQPDNMDRLTAPWAQPPVVRRSYRRPPWARTVSGATCSVAPAHSTRQCTRCGLPTSEQRPFRAVACGCD